MTALTRPAARRPASAPSAFTRPPARPRRSGGLYDPAVLSDGLTVDTALGPVDLVAVDRVLRGHSGSLTEAERAWIVNRQANGARRRAAEALGTGYTGLLRSLARHRRQLARTAG
jgi:hypothetical protein